MENLNNIPKTGTIGGMVNGINENFTLIKEMLERLGTTKDASCGLFSTLADLQTAYPSPSVGEWALVGTSSPFAVYECATAGTWEATGGTYSGDIDLSDYATKEDVEQISVIISGGSVSTDATTTWTSSQAINATTGAISNQGSSYSSSGFIEIPTGTTQMTLMALCILPGSSVFSAGLAFYSSNSEDSFLSGIQREEYDHGGSSTVGMAERTYNVPSTARYMRTTCKGDTSSWYCKFLRSVEGMTDRLDDVETSVSNANTLAQSAYDLAEEAYELASEPSHDVYTKNETMGATNTSAKKGVAVYTPLFNEAKDFNTFIVKGITSTEASTAEWRIYQFQSSNTDNDNVPSSGTIGSSHTLLASGTVNLTADKTDLKVDIGSKITCAAGYQVIIYFVSTSSTLSLGVPSATDSTTHVTYYNNNDTPWTTWWSRGGSAFNVCAPILRWESGILSEEDVQNMIDTSLIGLTPPDWKICLPSKIHVLVGGEINLWNDGISLPLDSGLKSPLNYSVQWVSSLGGVIRKTPRGVCIRPTQVGAFTLTCRMLTNDGKHLIDSKEITIVAVAKNALTTSKNIVCVGSSSCPYTTHYIDVILSDSTRFTGTKPTLHGTVTTVGTPNEGHGGWKWTQFYSSASPGGVINPMYDTNLAHASASYYRNQLGMGSTKFDLVLFQLGLNDFIQLIGSTPKTVEEYREAYTMQQVMTAMDNLINEFVSDNADCKILLALPYICNNSGGLGTSQNIVHWEMAKASYAMRLNYIDYVAEHPDIILVAGHQMIDRWYGFQMDEFMVSGASYDTYAHKEIRPHDNIHCGTVGYKQYAEGFAASIIAALGTTDETEADCGYDTSDIIATDVSPIPEAEDSTARTAAAAAQTTANMALSKKNGAVFDVYDTGSSAPLDGGSTTSSTGTMYYFKANNSFMLKVGNSYYGTFPMYPNASLYEYPFGHKIYYCDGVAYVASWADGVLVALMESGGGGVESVAQIVTMQILNNVVWVGTQAQYDALTTAQKQSIIAFIVEA